MVLKDINLLLNKQHAAYFPGEMLRGELSFFVHSSKDVKVSEMYVKFNGVAKVSWTVSDSSGDSTDTTTYSSSESYIKSRYDIIKATDLALLRPGRHLYEFSFLLPENIPPSFKGNDGGITYILKIRVKVPWKFSHKYEVAVNVCSKLTIKDYPELKIPHDLSMEKEYTSCCSSGEIIINVKIPRTAYLRGEIIDIMVNLNNNSNVAVKDLVFKLRKHVEYISNFPRTEKNTTVLTVAKLHGGVFPAGLPKRMNYLMQIPNDLEIFDLKHCNIINFSYILFVTAIFGGASRSLTEKVPLVIMKS